MKDNKRFFFSKKKSFNKRENGGKRKVMWYFFSISILYKEKRFKGKQNASGYN